MYINISSYSISRAREYINTLLNSKDIVKLKKTYDVLIMPVKDQETKIEVFSRDKIEKAQIKLGLDKLQELQNLIK